MRNASRTDQVRPALLGLFLLLGLASAGAAAAQDLREDGSAIIYTEVIIPDATPPSQTLDKRAEYFAEGKVVDLAQYLGIIYNFLISIAGLVASVMIIVGGFQYLTSAGDAGKIGAAKTRMTNAFMGLLLVLGAYTILKTINPALVTLKVPGGITNVATKLVTLPWCDEVEKGVPGSQAATVNPIWGEPGKCGSVGEFMNGKSRLVCLYRSACENHLGSDVPSDLRDSKFKGALHSTCVQTLTTSAFTNEPFTDEDVLYSIYRDKLIAEYKAKGGVWPVFPETAEGDMAWKDFRRKNLLTLLPPAGSPRSASDISGHAHSFATCASCLEYGYAVQRAKIELPEGEVDHRPQLPHQGRCDYWQNEANGGVGLTPDAWEKRKAAGQPLLSYCRWMPDEGGCAQADFECHEPISENGCGAYDNIKPFYMFDFTRGGYIWWIYGAGKNGTLSSRPDALQNVCFANPCGYNRAKGCTGSGGVIDGIRTAAAAVRDGIVGIQNCVNK